MAEGIGPLAPAGPTPPPCPSCGGTMVAILYGMVTGPVEFDGPYRLAGCCKPVPTPIARCDACGHEVFEDQPQ